MFALILSLAAGIRPIITSSSDAKLESAKTFGETGAIDTINYRTHPEWHEEALRLTGGRGVDVVIENSGPSTADKSLASIARRGIVSIVGFLGGFENVTPPDLFLPTMLKSATIRYVLGFFLLLSLCRCF